MNHSYKLDAIIRVDESLCITCGGCIRICPPGGGGTTGEFPSPSRTCGPCVSTCGHCVATCPTGAMRQRSMGARIASRSTFILSKVGRQFLISWCSIRGYIKEPIEKEKILQMLDIARYAPNGANRQVIRRLVINDPVQVQRIGRCLSPLGYRMDTLSMECS